MEAKKNVNAARGEGLPGGGKVKETWIWWMFWGSQTDTWCTQRAWGWDELQASVKVIVKSKGSLLQSTPYNLNVCILHFQTDKDIFLMFPFTRLNVSGWGGTKTVEVWISQVCFWAFYFRAQLSIKHHKTETLQARSVWPTTAPEAAAVRTNEVWMPTVALQAKSNINSYDWWKLHHALTQISNGKD